MCEDVYYKGKITPVFDKTAEQICKDDYGIIELPYYFDSWEQMLGDRAYEESSTIDGVVYKVEVACVEVYDDIFRASKNEDGSISVELKYYNGGCSFDEALECALDKMNANKH